MTRTQHDKPEFQLRLVVQRDVVIGPGKADLLKRDAWFSCPRSPVSAQEGNQSMSDLCRLRLRRIHYVYNIRHMDTQTAIDSFSALAQETRLAAFRLLVRHEREGLPAGEIARLVDVPHNTMSAHLAILTRARLLSSHRASRSIIYRADLAQVQETIRFLVRDCCGGRPEVCEPLLDSLADCRPSQT